MKTSINRRDALLQAALAPWAGLAWPGPHRANRTTPDATPRATPCQGACPTSLQEQFGRITRPFMTITGSLDGDPFGAYDTGVPRAQVCEGLPPGQRGTGWHRAERRAAGLPDRWAMGYAAPRAPGDTRMFDIAIAGSLPKPAWWAETQKLWLQWKASSASPRAELR